MGNNSGWSPLIVFFSYHGSQWVTATVWLEIHTGLEQLEGFTFLSELKTCLYEMKFCKTGISGITGQTSSIHILPLLPKYKMLWLLTSYFFRVHSSYILYLQVYLSLHRPRIRAVCTFTVFPTPQTKMWHNVKSNFWPICTTNSDALQMSA